MKNIVMLSLANIRKNKSQTVSLLIFVLIAATLLNIGLVLLLEIGAFFDERAEQNHAAHYTAIYSSYSGSIDEGLHFMKSDERVTGIERIDVVGGMGEYYMNGLSNSAYLYLSPAGAQQKMDAPSIVGDSRPLTGDAIYVPHFIMLVGDYSVGDVFALQLSGLEMDFTIAGGTEEIMFGAQFNTIHRFYISDEIFNSLQEQLPEDKVTLLSARLENGDDDIFFLADYNKAVSTEGLHFDMTLSGAKQGRTMVPTIAAIVVTAFSIILLTVSMIVIRFRIINSIEESMVNIGTQKAIGYRSVQIVSSIVLQFACVAAIGGIAGVALAQAALPLITKALEPMTALRWIPGFDITAALVSVFTVVFVVTLISYISTRRINKLHPLIALRGGTAAYGISKNTFPLEKARAPLSFLLALKQLAQKKKQAIAISIIIAAVTMASVAGVAVSYNMSGGRDNFARAFFGEMPDANFMLKSADDGEAFKERLLKRPDVRKAFGYETAATLLVDEVSILATVAEDCSMLEGNMLIDGRLPANNKEIALGAPILAVAGKGIGDTVMVKSGEIEEEYTVTGLVQFMNAGGFNGIITGGGLTRIQPGYKFFGFNTYLEDGSDLKDFIKDVQETEGDIIAVVVDLEDQLQSTMSVMSGIFAAVAAGVVAVTGFVVVLVLYIVIKTTILRRKREFGIQKAVGFTTFQLMNQVALNMTPIILIGVVLGAVAGYFGLNPMMVALMGGMGIVKVELPVPVDLTIIICLALVALAYIVSMLIARRIRKISAYSLVVE